MALVNDNPGVPLPGSGAFQGPLPGPADVGPDLDALRVAFDDLLADSASAAPEDSVGDHQVQALDAAHELLAEALSVLDRRR